MHPSRAAFEIQQGLRRGGVADAPRQRSKPRRVGSQCFGWGTGTTDIWMAAPDPRPIEHGLSTEDPVARLIVASDLAATDDSRSRVDPCIEGRNCGHVDDIISSPAYANVGADIAAGPAPRRRQVCGHRTIRR